MSALSGDSGSLLFGPRMLQATCEWVRGQDKEREEEKRRSASILRSVLYRCVPHEASCSLQDEDDTERGVRVGHGDEALVDEAHQAAWRVALGDGNPGDAVRAYNCAACRSNEQHLKGLCVFTKEDQSAV